MANDKRIAETILKYTVDQRSVREAAKSADAVELSLEDIREELGSYGALAESSVGALQREFRDANTELRETQTLIDDLERGLRDIDSIDARPSVTVQRGGGGRTPTPLDALDRFGTVGSQVFGAVGSSELGNLAGLAGDLGQSLVTLGPAATAATGAVAGLVVGLAALRGATESGRRALLAALDAQRVYYEAIASLSRTEAQSEIDERQRQQAVIQAQLEETRRAFEAAQAQQGDAFGSLGNLALSLTGVLPTRQLSDRLVELQSEFDANAQAIVRLEAGLEEGAFAAESAAEAEERLARAREKEQAAADLLTAQYAERLEAVDAEVKARDALAQASEALATADADSQGNLERIREQGAQRLIDIEQDAADAVARIRENSALQQQDAISSRDALAFVRAARQRDQQLRDQKRTEDRQRDQAARAAEDALRNERARFDNESRVRRAAYQQAQADLVNALNATRLLNQQTLTADISAKVQAANISRDISFQAGLRAGEAFATAALAAVQQKVAQSLSFGGGFGGGKSYSNLSPFQTNVTRAAVGVSGASQFGVNLGDQIRNELIRVFGGGSTFVGGMSGGGGASFD